MLSCGKSIAFGTKKGAFQPPFLYPYTDYQVVTISVDFAVRNQQEIILKYRKHEALTRSPE